MSSGSYRIYVRYGESNCVRFFAPGNGLFAGDGLKLFEWVRNPRNITRLRNGLQHVHEIDPKELRHFLEFKLRENRSYTKKQMKRYSGGDDMLAAFSQKYAEFASLRSGVDMLEAISNATEPTVIPRTSPRKRSDKSEWLYLLNLDNKTLEVYEFKDYKPHKLSPFARLTIQSLYLEYPKRAPGYYIKLKLSELQSMWRTEWITLHEIHSEALDRLWKRNAAVLQTIPHADTIPFTVLYGSASYRHGNRTKLCRTRRLAHAGLTEILGVFNRRQPSKIPIFANEPGQHPSVADNRLYECQARTFSLQGGRTSGGQQRRARRG